MRDGCYIKCYLRLDDPLAGGFRLSVWGWILIAVDVRLVTSGLRPTGAFKKERTAWRRLATMGGPQIMQGPSFCKQARRIFGHIYARADFQACLPA